MNKVTINDTHSKGFKYIQKALNYLSNSKHAPKILHKYNIGDSLLLHIEMHKSITKLGNSKSFENQLHKQILGSSVLSIDDSQTKKQRKKPQPYNLKRKQFVEHKTENNTDSKASDSSLNLCFKSEDVFIIQYPKPPNDDYSKCSDHFTFESMNKALCIGLKYGSNHVDNCAQNENVIYHERGKNYKCVNECKPCDIKLNMNNNNHQNNIKSTNKAINISTNINNDI